MKNETFNETIKVIIAEDQALIRGALTALLNLEADIEIVGEAENGVEAVKLLDKSNADILLTDIEMPLMSGLELAQITAKKHPQVKTVVITTFGRAGYIKRALTIGVKGFLLKDTPSDELAAALRKVMQGKKVIDPELAIAALDDIDPLSDNGSISSSAAIANSGSITFFPCITFLRAAANSSDGVSLSKKPFTPIVSARLIYPARPNVVMTTVFISGCFFAVICANSMPLIKGISISVSKISALHLSSIFNASTPFSASPTISISVSKLSNAINAPLMSA